MLKTTGREHVSNGATTEPEAEGFNPAQALPGDGAALRNYTRQWSYDQVGNILSLIHTANAGNWNRSYAYASDSNRLSTTTVGQTTDSYSHNAHGSFTTMPHLDVLDWDHNEHLSHVKRGTSETWYVYDGAGQRVRKLTEKPGQSEERLYLGGFEIYRKSQSSTVTLERETLHIMDGVKRIALVETRTIGSDSSPQTIRYQLDNHLQSATLELDEAASVISYEEYYPYGDTSYQSGRNQAEVQRKRYRYTGKEKDEESGLYYHGARYYAPWLGRWTAADPAGMVDGACLYAYVRNHPTGLIDPDGKASDEAVRRHDKADQITRDDRTSGDREIAGGHSQKENSTATTDHSIAVPTSDITEDFLRKLIDAAHHMEDFYKSRENFSIGVITNSKYSSLIATALGKIIANKMIEKKLSTLKSDDISEILTDKNYLELAKNATKFREFSQKVQTYGDWDLKNIAPEKGGYANFKNGVTISGSSYKLDVTGNFMYGYAGAASGFSLEILEKMAGLAQKHSDLKSHTELKTIKSYWDDPRDQIQIKAGYYLFQAYGDHIDSRKLNEALKVFEVK